LTVPCASTVGSTVPRTGRGELAAGGLRRGAERLGDAGVVAVLEHAQAQRLALAVGQLGQQLVEAVEPGRVGLGGGRRPVEPVAEPEALAGELLEPFAPDGHEQDVAGDPEQPRERRPARLVPEALAREPGLRERLGGQVVRRVGIPRLAQVLGVDAGRVADVELVEGSRVMARRGEELRPSAPAGRGAGGVSHGRYCGAGRRRYAPPAGRRGGYAAAPASTARTAAASRATPSSIWSAVTPE
jgi:hypothetical protein